MIMITIDGWLDKTNGGGGGVLFLTTIKWKKDIGDVSANHTK